MKKTYEKPLIEIVDLENQDIIMLSVLIDTDDGEVGWDVFDEIEVF